MQIVFGDMHGSRWMGLCSLLCLHPAKPCAQGQANVMVMTSSFVGERSSAGEVTAVADDQFVRPTHATSPMFWIVAGPGLWRSLQARPVGLSMLLSLPCLSLPPSSHG